MESRKGSIPGPVHAGPKRFGQHPGLVAIAEVQRWLRHTGTAHPHLIPLTGHLPLHLIALQSGASDL